MKRPVEKMASLLARDEKYVMLEDKLPPQGDTLIDAPLDLWSSSILPKNYTKTIPVKRGRQRTNLFQSSHLSTHPYKSSYRR